MPARALLLTLIAAALHTGWNTLAKQARDSFAFLLCSMGLSGLVLLVPSALVGLPLAWANGALPWLLATCSLHAVYFLLLGASYRDGALSVVYPITRGLGVALVPLIAYALWQETLSPLGLAAIALVASGVAVAGLAGIRGQRLGARLFLPVATGLVVASYSIVDARGARLAHPLPYVTLMALGAVAALTPVAIARRAAIRQEIAVNGRRIALAALMNLSGYMLVLWAYRISKTGYVVAARESSIVLSFIVGVTVLREQATRARITAAVLISAGVFCAAFAK